MPSVARIWFLAAAVLLADALSAGASGGNWITIKNDTGKTIVVQETVVVNGQVRRGKAKNLLPGETFREFVPGPTVKRVEVFDAQQPARSLWCGNLSCKAATQEFAVTSTSGKVAVNPLAAPTRK